MEYEGVSDGSRYKPAPGRRSGCRLGWSATGTATTSKGRTLQVEIRGAIRTFPGGGAEDSSTRPELQAVVAQLELCPPGAKVRLWLDNSTAVEAWGVAPTESSRRRHRHSNRDLMLALQDVMKERREAGQKATKPTAASTNTKWRRDRMREWLEEVDGGEHDPNSSPPEHATAAVRAAGVQVGWVPAEHDTGSKWTWSVRQDECDYHARGQACSAPGSRYERRARIRDAATGQERVSMGNTLPACAWATSRPFTTDRDEWFVLQRQEEDEDRTATERKWERARMCDGGAARRPVARTMLHTPNNDEEWQDIQMMRQTPTEATRSSTTDPADETSPGAEPSTDDRKELAEHNGITVAWVAHTQMSGSGMDAWPDHTDGGRPTAGDMIAMVDNTMLPGPKLRREAAAMGRRGTVTDTKALTDAIRAACRRGTQGRVLAATRGSTVLGHKQTVSIPVQPGARTPEKGQLIATANGTRIGRFSKVLAGGAMWVVTQTRKGTLAKGTSLVAAAHRCHVTVMRQVQLDESVIQAQRVEVEATIEAVTDDSEREQLRSSWRQMQDEWTGGQMNMGDVGDGRRPAGTMRVWDALQQRVEHKAQSHEQRHPHITVDVRKAMVAWSEEAYANECKTNSSIDGNLARHWKDVDETAFAEVMLKPRHAQWSGPRLYTRMLRERWTTTGLRAQVNGKDTARACVAEYMAYKHSDPGMRDVCMFGCQSVDSAVVIEQLTDAGKQWKARLGGRDGEYDPSQELPPRTTLMDANGRRVGEVTQHDDTGLYIKRRRTDAIIECGHPLTARPRGDALHTARCERLIAAQAAQARAFSTTLWTQGCVGSFLGAPTPPAGEEEDGERSDGTQQEDEMSYSGSEGEEEGQKRSPKRKRDGADGRAMDEGRRADGQWDSQSQSGTSDCSDSDKWRKQGTRKRQNVTDDVVKRLQQGGLDVPVNIIRTPGAFTPDVVCFGPPQDSKSKKGVTCAHVRAAYGSHGAQLSVPNLRAMCEAGEGDAIAPHQRDIPKLRQMLETAEASGASETYIHHEEYYRKVAARTGEPIGNMTSAHSFAVQRLPVGIRGALCGPYHLDVDMKNAHPVALTSRFGEHVPTFVDYVRNRGQWIQRLGELHPDSRITLSDKKDLFRAAANRRQPEDMYINWCKSHQLKPKPNSDLAKDLRRMGEEIAGLRNKLRTEWRNWDGEARDVTNLSHLMSTLTHDALMVTIKVMEKHGWKVEAAVFDGVHVARQPGRWPNLREIEREVRHITGWKYFEVTCKTFTEHTDLPRHSPPTDVNQPCCDACERKKRAWESTKQRAQRRLRDMNLQERAPQPTPRAEQLQELLSKAAAITDEPTKEAFDEALHELAATLAAAPAGSETSRAVGFLLQVGKDARARVMHSATDSVAYEDTGWIARRCRGRGCSDLAKPGEETCINCEMPNAEHPQEPEAAAVRIAVATTTMERLWTKWKDCEEEQQTSARQEFGQFIVATHDELRSLGGMKQEKESPSIAVHEYIEGWMCRTFGLTTRRWATLIGWLDGPPQLRDVTMCKDVTEKWAKRLYRGWAGETTMETERGHAEDWQNSRSLIALDLDTPTGRQMAERARDIMNTRDGPGWDGIVVALLVAKEPRSIRMITDDDAH